VAGSIGPYGACLGDMSEFSGSYIGSVTKQVNGEVQQPSGVGQLTGKDN